MNLPVTIVGGYLGAGKTSLVNHLLRHADGMRLAVLVNEFGTLPIDADLIEAEDGQMISIAGGCVCCSYGSDLAAALRDLQRLDPVPDHVVLEASGVALPGAIAGAVSLMSGFAVDGVVVLADAETVVRNAADAYMGDTVTRQLRDADLVVLNKIDLQQGDAARALIARYAGRAEVVPATHGKVPPDVVLQSHPGRLREGRGGHDTSLFDSAWVPLDRPTDPAALGAALAQERLGLVRAKGFVMDGTGSIFAVQTVARRVSVVPADHNGPLGMICIGLKPGFDVEAVSEAAGGALLPSGDGVG